MGSNIHHRISGAGFTPTIIEVFFGGIALAKVGAPPGEGQFSVDGTGTTNHLQAARRDRRGDATIR